MAGDDVDRRLALLAAQPLDQFDSIFLGHHDVEADDGRLHRGIGLAEGFGGIDQRGDKAFLLGHAADEIREVEMIIDDENPLARGT